MSLHKDCKDICFNEGLLQLLLRTHITNIHLHNRTEVCRKADIVLINRCLNFILLLWLADFIHRLQWRMSSSCHNFLGSLLMLLHFYLSSRKKRDCLQFESPDCPELRPLSLHLHQCEEALTLHIKNNTLSLFIAPVGSFSWPNLVGEQAIKVELLVILNSLIVYFFPFLIFFASFFVSFLEGDHVFAKRWKFRFQLWVKFYFQNIWAAGRLREEPIWQRA